MTTSWAWITNDMQTNNIFWLSVIKHKILYFNLYIIRTSGRRTTPFSSIHIGLYANIGCETSSGMRFSFAPFAVPMCHESFDKNFSSIFFMVANCVCVFFFCLFYDTIQRRYECASVCSTLSPDLRSWFDHNYCTLAMPGQQSTPKHILSQRECSLQNANRSCVNWRRWMCCL